MTEKEFNSYLTKFKSEHYIKIDPVGIATIKGKHGKIEPYSPKNKLLLVCCINLSRKQKTLLLQKLTPHLIETHQDGECEFCAYFHEEYLNQIAKTIKTRKKRKLTQKQIKKCREQAKKNFKKK